MFSVLTWPSWRPVQPLHRTCQPGFVQNGIKKQMDCVSASPSDAHCRHSNSASALHCIPGMCSLFSTTTILTRPRPSHRSSSFVCPAIISPGKVSRTNGHRRYFICAVVDALLILAGTQPHQCVPIHSRAPLLESRLLPHARYDPPSISVVDLS